MHENHTVEIIDGGAALSVDVGDGSRLRFHAIWLRDNALDPATRSLVNGQRLIKLSDIPEPLTISTASMGENQTVTVVFQPENKTASFPLNWLAAHGYDRSVTQAPGWLPPNCHTWEGTLDFDALAADFDDICRSRQRLGRWLAGVRDYGFALLRGGPVRGGALLDVIARFGFVRETNYGRWFDVKSESQPANLANTNLGLQAHTDNPYRDPAPTLQLLYCLENSAQGGDSMVVDGFHAAERLREQSPQGFELLSRYCARFRYDGDQSVSLSSRRPMIELAPDGELIGIRFNNRSCAPITDVPYARMEAYYAAYRRFAAIIENPAMAVNFKLVPGESFLVDNTRVLHARRAYHGSGKRWFQGCYADKDGLLSTLSVIEDES